MKIWFVLRTYGVSGLKAHIRNHVKLGDMFYGLVKGRADLFKVLTPPAFALTVLTVVPRSSGTAEAVNSAIANGTSAAETQVGVTDGLEKETQALSLSNGDLQSPDTDLMAKANEVTKDVYELINSRGEIFLTSAVVNGIYVIRVVSANPKAEEKYLRRAFEILVETAEEVLAQKGCERQSETNGVGE